MNNIILATIVLLYALLITFKVMEGYILYLIIKTPYLSLIGAFLIISFLSSGLICLAYSFSKHIFPVITGIE